MIRTSPSATERLSSEPAGTQIRRSMHRRGELLRAATRVLMRSGIRALTLDAVAREAGTSKGGLLHHFPTKANLLECLLNGLIESIRQEVVRRVETDPDPRGSRLRAYIDALADPRRESDRSVVLATLLADPDAVLRWQAFSNLWLEPDLKGIDEARADLVRLLAEGTWLAIALGLHPTEAPERVAALQRLLRQMLS